MKITPAILATLLLAACTSAPEHEDLVPQVENVASEPIMPRAWTTAFREPALLFADQVYIEGPRGLLDHFAARVEDGFHSYQAETLPEGFKQTFRVIDSGGDVELRGYLDAFELVVIQKLEVIEKPGKLDVLVRATGNVYWRDSATGRDHRATQLSFDGPIGAPVAIEPEATGNQEP
ncbi:MAG: hypothetical protein ACI9F9_002182 [Candidatus Paceibacteria bacterium]|jgi:hypothetical protein